MRVEGGSDDDGDDAEVEEERKIKTDRQKKTTYIVR